MEESTDLRGRTPGGWLEAFGRAIKSGTVGGLSAAIVAMLAGKLEDGAYAAPLNATSHIIWGDEAAHQDDPSLKYTFTGFLLNHASAIFWALFYEKLFGRSSTVPVERIQGSQVRPGKRSQDISQESAPPAKPLLGAAAVTAGAYIIDYFLIPKRFTPGFEKRLSGKSMTAIFAALAVGLAARDVMGAARVPRKRGTRA